MNTRKAGVILALFVFLACSLVPAWADRNFRGGGGRGGDHQQSMQQSESDEHGQRSQKGVSKQQQPARVEPKHRSRENTHRTQQPVRVERDHRNSGSKPRASHPVRVDRGVNHRTGSHEKRKEYKAIRKKERYELDKRYRHNHYYPRRGYRIKKLHSGYRTVHYHNKRYYHYHGSWYYYTGGYYVVIRPPIGLTLAFLPAFYTTIWVGGIPYYYANDVYYTWSPEERVYVVSEPPPESEEVERTEYSDRLFVYPKRGQSQQQQADDRYQCHEWATDQTNFDPTHNDGDVPESKYESKRADYNRAMKACLEARGYSVQ